MWLIVLPARDLWLLHLISRPELAGIMTQENIDELFKFQRTLSRERMADSNYIREEISRLPASKREIVQKAYPVYTNMPTASLTNDLIKAVDYLNAQPFVKVEKVASVGFCFGGGMSFNLACHAPLAACVVFYGSNPNPIEQVEAIPCPVLGLYGADDMRINRDLDKLVKAMVDYKKDFEMKIYPGAAHAFFNDTRNEVYRQGPAEEAWERVLRFYQRTLRES
jgi:carboxymethylenebutenolidase